jgi:hypothetical protein
MTQTGHAARTEEILAAQVVSLEEQLRLLMAAASDAGREGRKDGPALPLPVEEQARLDRLAARHTVLRYATQALLSGSAAPQVPDHVQDSLGQLPAQDAGRSLCETVQSRLAPT